MFLNHNFTLINSIYLIPLLLYLLLVSHSFAFAHSTEFIITIYPVIMVMISVLLKGTPILYSVIVERRTERAKTARKNENAIARTGWEGREASPSLESFCRPMILYYIYDYNANSSKSRLSLLNKWNQRANIGLHCSHFNSL